MQVYCRWLLSSIIIITPPPHPCTSLAKSKKIVVSETGATPSSVVTYGAARSYGEYKPSNEALEIKLSSTSKAISVTTFEDHQDVAIPLFPLPVQALFSYTYL